MSFKIIKGRKIQEWLEETLRHIFITLKGEEILLDLKKLPLPLKETIVVHAAEPYNASSDPMVKTFASMLGVDYSVSKKRMEQYYMKRGSNYMHKEYVQPVTVKSLKEEIAYKYSWSEKAPFPLIFKKYLEFNYKSLSTIIEEAENEPINIEERISGGWKTGGTWAGTGWAFKGYIYEMEYKNQPPYSKEEEELLILEQYDNEQNKFESLKRKFKSANIEEESYRRERISEEVRIAVWRRDDGKCARCGNRENLEYDHIVPVSKGGGNTARNIELLCESCNRKKSGKIE